MPADAIDTPLFVKSIRGWLRACDNQHACVDSSKSRRTTDLSPTWLVDTHQQCIVPAVNAGRYLALSYVWPENMDKTGAQPVQLDRARLLHFQTPGVLKDVSDPFPKVIRDAIELTQMVKERYLWVDRICIVQDADDTASEVMKMDQIYSGAYLTIISAGSHGLFTASTVSGLHSMCVTGLCTSNTPNRINACCSSAELVNYQIRSHYRNLSKSKWATRGWTYQEQILSRRSVVFLDREIFWECDRSVWDGHKLSPENDGTPTAEASDMGRRLFALQWPDFGLYIDLVCLYNYRDFSHQQDALVAISGIFNVLGPVYPGGFIGGLPSTFLDCALLWQPLRKGTRREGLPKGTDSPASGFSLPSWSWCGWQCLVDPWSLQSGVSYISRTKHRGLAGTWRTRNLVTWSTTTPYGDEKTMHEPSKFDEQVKKLSCRSTRDIPAGWSKRDGLKTGSSNASAAGSSYNGDDSTSSTPPIPISQTSLPHNINSASRWLRCATTGAFFRPAAVLQVVDRGIVMGAPKISAFEHPMFTTCPKIDQVTPVMVLQDMHGRRSGLLRLMCDEEDYDHLGQIELIAISTGSCSVRDLIECFEQQAFQGVVEWPGSTMTLQFGPTWLHPTFRSDGGSESDLHRLTLPSSLRQGHITYGIDETCYFYNVLWIERENGVAYRRACGRILKPIWEQNEYGDTKVTLG